MKVFELSAMLLAGVLVSAPLWSPAASAAPAAFSVVSVPLDKSDKRFGKFYVPSLTSILFRPDTTQAAPTIIYLHGCGGISGPSLPSAESYATTFLALGYATLILDTNDDRRLSDKPCRDRDTNLSLLSARRADLDAAAAWLVAQKISIAGKIVPLGTSHGGQVVIEHDQRGGGMAVLAGEISFYPGCDRGSPYARYPLLILVGDKDMSDGPSRSLAQVCAGYAKAAARAGRAPVEEVTYPGAGHAFDVAGLGNGTSQSLYPTGSGYQAEAAKASLAKVEAFLADVLK